MSVKLMSAVFESLTLGPTDRLVLLALADHAGEDCTCYPSIARLCRRTGLGERAVQIAIKRLKEAGYLKAAMGGGRGNSTLYTICINPAPETPFDKPRIRNPVSPALNPASNALNPAPDAPEPSITIIEPSVDKNVAPKSFMADGWVPSEEGWAYARKLKIPDEVIEDEARGFQAYWADRRDRDARKSERGWEQCWANRCRSIAGRYAGRGMAGQASAGGYGQGGSIASIAARRRASGAV